jgi:serine/threonine protein kinase
MSHSNVVTVHDFFEHAGTPYIAMEYLPRGSLRPYMGNLSLAHVAGVFDGLLAGLSHAEEEGIVHRDLKPENLMLSRDGQIKIADFGIAKALFGLQSGMFQTATGMTVGTPAYMAPEQAMSEHIGPWTDLYAVGVIAFELFMQRVPFPATESPMAVMMRHINTPIPPVSSLNPSVPESISDWIGRLLVKDPAHRTSSAADAWDELEEIVIDLLGPRWRRQAMLTAPTEAEREYETYHPGRRPGGAAPGPATPPPADLPPGPLVPGPPDVRVAQPAPGSPPGDPAAEAASASPPGDPAAEAASASPPEVAAEGPTRPGVGDSVGDYLIEEILTVGATTSTYRARSRALDRDVSLKVFDSGVFESDPAARARARGAAVQAASLEHPAIAPVYSAGEFGGGMYVASALVRGDALTALVRGGRVTPGRCAELLAVLASALQRAHAAGVLHREVRPDAVVIDRWGHPILRDFGITRPSGRTAMATRLELTGTLQYQAPELVLGREASAASDVYGLAATALFCLTARDPFPDLSPAQLIALRVGAEVPRLACETGSLADLLAGAMDPEPASRPSLGALAAGLAAAVEQLAPRLRDAPSPFSTGLDPGATGAPPLPPEPRRDEPVAPRPPRPPRRRRGRGGPDA